MAQEYAVAAAAESVTNASVERVRTDPTWMVSGAKKK